MKVVIQRIKYSSVTVDNKLISEINKGLNVLVGIHTTDTLEDLEYIVKKIVGLRIFDDANGVMNKSVVDVSGEILSISQFTLQANTKNGNRPSYKEAMSSLDAEVLYERFNTELNKYVKTYSGVFGADMEVNILNDGPVTIIIDSKDK